MCACVYVSVCMCVCACMCECVCECVLASVDLCGHRSWLRTSEVCLIVFLL